MATNDESHEVDMWEDQDDNDGQPWRIVREKEHPGEPMTVEDALFHMELLGHDFYLFNDKESGGRAWCTGAGHTTTGC
jgi:hypothetical protein